MRGFILGGVITCAIWVFMTVGGFAKINQAWASYQQAESLELAKELGRERERAFAGNFRAGNGCNAPTSELKKLECRNQMDMARSSFYAQWNAANSHRFPK